MLQSGRSEWSFIFHQAAWFLQRKLVSVTNELTTIYKVAKNRKLLYSQTKRSTNDTGNALKHSQYLHMYTHIIDAWLEQGHPFDKEAYV